MLVITGDCRDVMASMKDGVVDSVVTDPPYGLSFMGSGWDHEVPGPDYWRAALRVAKPGAHLVAFGGTRKFHRLACAVEDAGWEIRDTLLWLYGSGMPKTGDASVEIDKRKDARDLPAILRFTAAVREARDRAGKTNREIDNLFGFVGMAGHWTTSASQPAIPTLEQWPTLRDFLGITGEQAVELDAECWRLNGRKGKPGPAWERREVIGHIEMSTAPGFSGERYSDARPREGKRRLVAITAPASEAAKLWEGWSATLRPAWEPIILARKPFPGTLAENLMAHGAGALNVAACSIDGDAKRWPTNVIIDEAAAEDIDASAGERRSGGVAPHHVASGATRVGFDTGERSGMSWPASRGGASRFFSRYLYTSKANTSERDLGAVKNTHKTVKPIALMRWLVELTTPRDGTVFDPFTGSGSTLVAAATLGIDGIGAELDEVNAEIARRRIGACGVEVEAADQPRPEVETPPQPMLPW